MPMYDYRCRDCGKRCSIYQTYEEYGSQPVHCPHCGSEGLERLVPRVRVARSDESRFDALGEASDWGDLDESDPRTMARMMRKMGSELGEEMPPEFDEVVGRLEAGESPDDIEASLPDLGAGDEEL